LNIEKKYFKNYLINLIKSLLEHISQITMYPYHNKIKQRIANNELLKYEYIDRYKNISPCLVLHFETEPYIRPIREHRFKEYETLLNSIAVDQKASK